MPRVERSPPATPAQEINTQPIFSTPEVNQFTDEREISNTTSRIKRLRPDFSPECELKSFEEKIMSMLTLWKDGQDALLEKLSSEISTIKLQNTDIKKTNVDVLRSIEFLSADYESLKTSIQNLEKENSEQRHYIMDLERKVMDLQLNSRSSSIEIRNVPANDKETSSDLISIVHKTCSIMQPSSSPPQLRDVYRLPGQRGSNRPIIAEFLTVPLKNQILNACRTFNRGLPTPEKLNTGHIGIPGEVKPIYVAEHMPRSLRQLFFEVRAFAKKNKYNFCWTQNGKIFLREREGAASVIIKSTSCLDKILVSKPQV